MTNGNGFPGVEPLPGLQDPVPKDSSGGGPGMPTGVGKTAEEKDGYEEAAFNANSYAIIAGFVAVVSFGTVGGPFVFGIMASGFAAIGQYFTKLAKDPPQPHEQIVTFEPRVSRPPGMNDPVLSPSGIAIQRAVFTLATARGLLDALERLASAQQAGDRNWAVTHYGVASQCYQALVVDLAYLSAAGYAAGKAISGSAFDVPVSTGAGGLRGWIESPGMKAKVVEAMRQSGFSTDEINDALRWWTTDQKYSGRATKASAALISGANKLYTSAQKLAKSEIRG